MPWVNGQWVNEDPFSNPNMQAGMAGKEHIPWQGGHISPGAANIPITTRPEGPPAMENFDYSQYAQALGSQGITPRASNLTSTASQGPFKFDQTVYGLPSGENAGITFGPGGALSPSRMAEITAVSEASRGAIKPVPGSLAALQAPRTAPTVRPSQVSAPPGQSGAGPSPAQVIRYGVTPSSGVNPGAASGGGSAYDRILARIRSRRP